MPRFSCDSREGREFCRRVLDQEVLILQVINFNLRIVTSLSAAFKVIKSSFNSCEEPVQKRISFITMWLIHTSYKSVVVLLYTPMEIALACIEAALECPCYKDLAHTYREYIGISTDWYEKYDLSLNTDKILGNVFQPLRNLLTNNQQRFYHIFSI